MTKPKPLTEKQIHFLEAWDLPMQPSFGYAHGLIRFLSHVPPEWNARAHKPHKAYTLRMLDVFWAFYKKWMHRDVTMLVRDKDEASTNVRIAFKQVEGTVVNVVGRPIGEITFLKNTYGYEPLPLKLSIRLEGESKPRVFGVSRVLRVKHNGIMMGKAKYYEVYKEQIEDRNSAWYLKNKTGRKLLKAHIKTITATVG